MNKEARTPLTAHAGANPPAGGVYVHVPFCRSRCIYCAFYSTTGMELRQRYVDAVCREWRMRSSELASVSTVYLGGGTPSQLTAGQLEQLLGALPVAEAAEVTIEVNPDDVTPAYAATLSQLGINRVSMGVQTFDDQRLRFLNRRHTAAQAAGAVSLLRQAGIGNISADLMYGFPGETPADWQRDIDAALQLGVEHLSAYCLTVEDGTPLQRMLSQTGYAGPALPDEELERQMYYTLIDRLVQAGYEHYELSNFARRGYRSRHNSSYWREVPYVGLGAAAHSYDGGSRSWNISDLRRYIEGMEHGQRISDAETLDDDTRYNDCITVALRTSEGLDLRRLDERHRDYCLREARPYLDSGLLRLTGDDRLVLTRHGLFVSDDIMSSLIYV